MKVSISCFAILLLSSGLLFSQSKLNTFLKPSDSLDTKRRNTVAITEAAMASATLIALNQLWYADYPRSKH